MLPSIVRTAVSGAWVLSVAGTNTDTGRAISDAPAVVIVPLDASRFGNVQPFTEPTGSGVSGVGRMTKQPAELVTSSAKPEIGEAPE